MKIKWTGGDTGTLGHAILAHVKRIEVDAEAILDEISREAVNDMYRILVEATTRTGEDRAARGEGAGIAGRVDTGQMARDIKAALHRGARDEVVLTWGWINNVEDYYFIQEYGDEKIKAMGALQQSYMKAREKLRQRFQDMGLEVNG